MASDDRLSKGPDNRYLVSLDPGPRLATDMHPGILVKRDSDGLRRAKRADFEHRLATRGLALTLQDFIDRWQGVGINPGSENPYGFQCVELSNEWLRELGVELFGGNAVDFASDPHPDCDWIPNTPSGVPRPGSVLVWGAMPGDPYGHTDVFVSGDANAFSGLDQNWPLGSLPHLQPHNWSYVLGWYWPRVLDAPVVDPGQFLGVVSADGGAHVRVLPGTDQAIVPQPGSNPDVVDKGTSITFDAWTVHPPPIPDAISGDPDARWFRTTAGHWMASATINGNPPADMAAIPDPNQAPTPVPPQPVPPLPFTGDPKVLEGRWCWEWNEAADYASLAKLGYTGVLIRAANGEGGAFDAGFLAQWNQRAPAARAAGLKVAAWTYWYGPGDAGYTEPDPAAYLQRCAAHTAALGLDTPAWVIDFESRDASGLPAACKALRDACGKAVIVAPPGDPNEYGIVGWPWKDLDAVVDAYAPQMYTGAWSTISLDKAYAEWSTPPLLYPVGDEQDPAKAKTWVAGVKAKGATGWSYWRSGVGTPDTLAAYVEASIPEPPPTPGPGPAPTPKPTPTPPGKGCLGAVLMLPLRILR